jgi:choline dehydrogenase-like flavoprotein
MIYMRGQAADYDGWRQLGLEGWGWDDVLPFFKRHEDYHGGADALHGAGGEWRIERPRIAWPILDAVRDAAAEVGIPKVDDFNRGDNEGCAYFDVNQRRGRRWSAARGFLKPILNRPNLRVVTGAHVERLAFEGRRAVGVRYGVDGVGHEARASGEIVLAAGAIGTPQLLELSGVGRPEIVASLGRESVHASPGVGENLQDHLQLRTIFRIAGARTLNVEYRSPLRRAGMALDYALRRRGPMTMAPSQLGAFAKSSPDFATANLEFHVQPLSLDRFGEPLHAFPAITLSVCNLRPTSRGSSHALGPDPRAAPEIRPNYLSTEEDARVAVDSIRLARRIAAAPALAPFRPAEHLPGAAAESDAELRRAAGDIGTTIFHPVGTAKMGRADDPTAVVDASLKLRGVGGIRIADASVMPRITSGNTAAPTMMIAEKAAAMILADAKAR